MNKVILMGEIVSDIVVNPTTTGKFILFSLQTKRMTGKKNPQTNKTIYMKDVHQLVCYNEIADIILRNKKTGDFISIDGYLTQGGITQQIVVKEVSFVESKSAV